jgi:hypothetical protein
MNGSHFSTGVQANIGFSHIYDEFPQFLWLTQGMNGFHFCIGWLRNTEMGFMYTVAS